MVKPVYSGNVHDVYELSEDKLIIVATDRMSVHGNIIPWTIKNKGIYLTKISNFWFQKTKDIIQNHIIETDINNMPSAFHNSSFFGRTVMVKKLKILPYEFIVRGYMYGRLWKSYQKGENLCGIVIPKRKYCLAEKLEYPILTPTIKLDHSRDVDIDIHLVEKDLGKSNYEMIQKVCIELFNRVQSYFEDKDLIIADTKFEFGVDKKGDIILADEIFTADSSRYWDLKTYSVGKNPNSFDKDELRRWLTDQQINGKYQYDKIPPSLITRTEGIYKQLFDKMVVY